MKHRVARAEMHHKLQQDNLKANIDYELNAARDIFENQRRELQDQAISLVEARAKKMDAARNIGKAVWESTGFGVIPYADPFPTGIDKRTPTGGFFSS